MASRRLEPGDLDQAIGGEAPTIVPPAKEAECIRHQLARDAQPLVFRGFMPVQPPPRRLVMKTGKS